MCKSQKITFMGRDMNAKVRNEQGEIAGKFELGSRNKCCKNGCSGAYQNN